MSGKIFFNYFKKIFMPWLLFAAIYIVGSLVSSAVTTSSSNFAIVLWFLDSLATMATYALPIATFVLLVKNYAADFFSSRAYLTFMLPVNRSTLFFAKILVACAYIIMDVVLFVVMSAFISLFTDYGVFGSLIGSIPEMTSTITTPTFFSVVLVGNAVIVGTYAFIAFVYEAITEFNLTIRPGGPKRIVPTIIITVVVSEVSFSFLLVLLLEGIFSAVYTIDTYDMAIKYSYDITSLIALNAALITLGAVFTLRAEYLLKNKLNVR